MFTDCSYDSTGQIVCIYRGMPFQCTEKETPDEWIALQAAINSGDVVVANYEPIPVVPPTPEEILAANTDTFSALKSQASIAMTPLLLSLQLGDATAAETASAKAWQAYSRALTAVDLTKSEPSWPSLPS
ncbi:MULTISPECIES: tail fiber assembly protein [Pseudomonas]|uniref:tail fiber assembly protein n=1 Tax=Pseudomonas TaxID=286 RepID=UPI001070B2F5|nr:MULTISPECIES: tail fiber assembly protein [Pseudomonas]QBR31898.1 tail assembly chaperone [Pseudomonas sp. S150]UZT95430.1 tail fiber assembly protein [Pseudomonas koreensis]